jgi:hypothetical protein
LTACDRIRTRIRQARGSFARCPVLLSRCLIHAALPAADPAGPHAGGVFRASRLRFLTSTYTKRLSCCSIGTGKLLPYERSDARLNCGTRAM